MTSIYVRVIAKLIVFTFMISSLFFYVIWRSDKREEKRRNDAMLISDVALKNLPNCERRKLLQQTKEGVPAVNEDIAIATDECIREATKAANASVAAKQAKLLSEAN